MPEAPSSAGLRQADASRRRLGRYALVGGSVALIVVAVTLMVLSNRAQETVDRVKCRKIMRALGQACLLYANENKGQMPRRIEDLMLTQDISPQIFICPSSGDSPAAGNTLEERAANLSRGGHLSYVMAPAVPRELLTNGKTVYIFIYEPLANHGDGFHAVYSDGQVEFITGPSANQIQADLRSGINPPSTFR
ncbi:MAG TPA: hypothetical protein VH475_24795 [Tepidisphaeraceae bacterium]